MTAKSQIDILVLVKDFPKVKQFYEQMNAAGFTPRGTEYVGIGDEYFTEDAPDGKRVVSVHVFPEGDPSRERYLNFRDYLRSHEEDRNLYISVKKSLYSENKENYEGYDSGKEDVIVDIRKRADEWVKMRSTPIPLIPNW